MENEVEKMNSQLWNGHVSEETSEGLPEYTKGLDQKIKKILSLLEQDGDTSMEKSELISYVKEISHIHHLLAEHYKNLPGTLQNDIQNNEGNNPSLLTPDKKLGVQNNDPQLNSSEVSLSSSGVISDFNEDSGSSSLSSDSDTESCNSSPSQIPGSLSAKKQKITTMDGHENEGYEMLLEKISKYEEELKASNEKLVLAEEEITQLKNQLQKNEEDMVKMGDLECQLVSANNKIELYEADIEMENKKSLSLQGQIVDLESKFVQEHMRVSELQESLGKYEADLHDHELQIQKLTSELQDASEVFALEKWELDSCISKLSEQLTFHEATAEELRIERESLADQIKKMETLKDEMEREHNAVKINWEADTEHMKAEIIEKNVHVGSLNENLNRLKLKCDMLVAEKDEVHAKLQNLNAEIIARDDQIQILESNLHELHSRNEGLYAESMNVKKLGDGLKSRIDELEEELRKHRMVISERGEEKREAIRQLCFSIDHYRGAYEELRNAYVMRKRPMAMVS